MQTKVTKILRACVKDFLKRHQLIRKKSCILLGLSGGPDSVALAHIMKGISQEMGLSFRALHLNHMLRGQESRRDQKFVQDFCRENKIALQTRKRDIRTLARKSKKNLEDTARNERYRFFQVCAEKNSGHVVLTAHTRDDQLETILMHLFRGTGLQGAGGIKEVSFYKGLCVARPFLGQKKKILLDYLKEQKLSFRQDLSNKDITFLRNRFRLKIIPYLKKELGDFSERLLNFGDICRDIHDFLEKQEQQLFSRFFFFRHQRLYISEKLFASYPFSVAAFALRRAMETLFSAEPLPEKKTLELFMALIQLQPGKMRDIPGNLVFLRERGHIILLRKKELSERNSTTFILRPGKEKNIVFFDWTLMFHITKSRTSKKQTAKTALQRFHKNIRGNRPASLKIFLSWICEPGKMTVRSVRDGERIIFTDKTKRHTKKIKDLFINAKIPLYLKKKIPVLEYRKKIICIPGLYIHPDFQVKHETKTVLELEIQDV